MRGLSFTALIATPLGTISGSMAVDAGSGEPAYLSIQLSGIGLEAALTFDYTGVLAAWGC